VIRPDDVGPEFQVGLVEALRGVRPAHSAIEAGPQERARIEMAERQAREGTTLQNIAMGGIKNLLDEKGQVRKDVDMTPSVIARLLEVGVKIERLTGEARSRSAWAGGPDSPARAYYLPAFLHHDSVAGPG